MRGQVIRINAGFYDVKVADKEYRVRGSGNMRNLQQNPLVGDFVEFTIDGMLEKILPRKNALIRPKVANVDAVAIVTSIKEPAFSTYMLNKMLATIEFQHIKPLLIFTKKDLDDAFNASEFVNQGYQVFEISNLDVTSTEKLLLAIKNQLVVFTGQTGAGKTSTINSLSGLSRATQAISKSLGRGKHTTRVVEVVEFGECMLIDTPGFSSLELPLTQRELANSFFEYRQLATKCKFRSCLHWKEAPEICAVRLAVEQKASSESRYKDYLKLLQEAKNE